MIVTEKAEVDIEKGRAELHRLIDQLPERAVFQVLDDVRWLLSDEEEALTEEELAEVEEGFEQIRRGEYVTLDEIARRLDG
jgi:predicted transcriptional regulator